MSYETTLYCGVKFNRKTYRRLEDVEYDIAELEKEITDARAEIMALAAMTEPEKMLEPFDREQYSNAYEAARDRAVMALAIVEEGAQELAFLYLLKYEWQFCHTESGKPLLPPEHFIGRSFIDGDFLIDQKKGGE